MNNDQVLLLIKFFCDLSLEMQFEGTPTPFTRSLMGDYPLSIAVHRGRVDLIGPLLELGVDLNAKGDAGYTALHEAVECGNVDAINKLIELGANVDVLNDIGQSPVDLWHALYPLEKLCPVAKTGQIPY